MKTCLSCGHTNSEAARFCESCAAPLLLVSEEQRKVVTVLFCDVVGSTELGETTDPEALRALLARYFERMKQIVTRHGGAVEKFIGDAVMAVFGVPAAHEDDALRACRAAIEMRTAFDELAIEGRIGVASGEVVAGTAERLATGDAVNLAARLEQSASPGEVLIGERTLALAGEAVEVEPVGPLTLKGKARPVAAFRLLATHESERRYELRFVGRDRELGLIHEAWQRAVAERRCELVTIVGEAGVGKSRLVAEALAALDARTVQGRCLPYGDGITYLPVIEVIKQLDALPPDPAAAASIRVLVGESAARTTAEEIAWAFRKLLEQVAPIVVVFEDIHSGEDALLDLVEHVALLSKAAPILLLCLARPELLSKRSEWPVALHLEPLTHECVTELIGDRVPESLRERIADAAGGNPLFLVEILALAEQTADFEVPATVRALLAARLDQLEAPERRLLERAAVQGELFHRGALQALTAEETHVSRRLAALVRDGLILPDRAQVPGEDGFRFRHQLIRDAAYDTLPKATRAELHRGYAAWLELHGIGLVELDEVLGYHLDRAIGYRQELGLPEDVELRSAARRRLAAAGRRAHGLQDLAAAARLLERAAALTPPGEVDVPLEIDLLDALFQGGWSRAALERAASMAERAAAVGDQIGELCGRIREHDLRLWFEPEGAAERLAALVEQALPVFESAGNDVALYVAYRALGGLAQGRGQMDQMVEAYERAASHAARAGIATQLVDWRDLGLFSGSTPLSKFLAWQDEQDEHDPRQWTLRGTRAWSLAMLGRAAEARALLAGLRADLAERGAGMALASINGLVSVGVELLAGDPAAAVAVGEEGCRLLGEFGNQSALSTAAGYLAGAYYELDRLEEADAWASRSAALGASDDVLTQMSWRQVRAKVLARRGLHAEAERLAREAVAIGEGTDMLKEQADVHADLAEVLSLAGRRREAAEALAQALARYERKENLVMAGRARSRLAALEQRSTEGDGVRSSAGSR